MGTPLKDRCDQILAKATSGQVRVPGVVAMVTGPDEMLYQGAAGVKNLAQEDPMTTDTVVCIFSCTKAITGTAAMQLVEEGRLDLDAPAKNYVPELGEVKVIEGFDSSGNPVLRPPKRDITTRMLMLHTAGFGYEFLDENYLRLLSEHGQPSIITCSKASITSPLLFDPGEGWAYGINMDWCGQVVERITGKGLDQVMKERIFEPLGMKNSGFFITDGMRKRLAVLHQRGEDGSLTPLPDLQLPQEPEVFMGGQGLYSTVGDYIRFIRMLLNKGQGEGGRVLKPETVAQMANNGLGARKITAFKTTIPSLCNDAEFFPEITKSWGYSFMINDEKATTGRPAGALGWAGLANSYYWIDTQNGLGGFWTTQVLPFADEASFSNYLEFETAVYDHWQTR